VVDICDLLRDLLLLYRDTLFDSRGIAVETLLPTHPVRLPVTVTASSRSSSISARMPRKRSRADSA
jgi:hypothetical protein